MDKVNSNKDVEYEERDQNVVCEECNMFFFTGTNICKKHRPIEVIERDCNGCKYASINGLYRCPTHSRRNPG